jgi:hypothetical protein
MQHRVWRILALLAACSCWGKVQFPTYPYSLPAIAQMGGPVYVIPGTVTDTSTISLTSVAGVACLQADPVVCMNAAGIVTAGGAGPGTTSTFSGTIGASSNTWNFGALLMSIEGVGTVQVFQANAANGLNSASPPTSFTLSSTTFQALGFPAFSRQNLRITFFVADDYYPDNSDGFLLTLQSPTLTYNMDSTQKVVQVVGPCDWFKWNLGAGSCDPTAASGDPSQILGMDLGFSFEDTTAGNLIFLFGDTIGVDIPSGVHLNPVVQDPTQFPNFHGHDAIAEAVVAGSTAMNFQLDFLSVPGTSPGNGVPDAPVFVRPSSQPNGTPVDMGAFDVPNSGIHVLGENYIIVNTGHTSTSGHEFSYSVLVQYISNANFTSGRTLSTANISKEICEDITCLPYVFEDGHFVYDAPHELPLAFAQQLGLSQAGVLIFGNGQYRAESIYLSYIPEAQFWLGQDSAGTNTTQYFMGLDASGRPTWTTDELCAVPVVYDNPTHLPTSRGCITQTGPAVQPVDPGTAGNVSVAYNRKLSLWLMTWDGGRQSPTTSGIYFAYASAPWGPWSDPQRIYNACEAASYGQGFGNFIRYVSSATDNPCPAVTSQTGPQGPIIGTDDPFGTGSDSAATRRGGVYAPFQIEHFATVEDDGLSIYFDLSTWNPYTVVLMQSDFTIAP